MVKIVEINGSVFAEVELDQFSVDAVLESRGETLDQYMSDAGDGKSIISVQHDTEFVAIQLFNNETTTYLGKASDYTGTPRFHRPK